MSYVKENFLLTNKTAEKLYFGYAKDMPIFDYHCHLPEKQILENKEFGDIFEVWLSGDHYKWRLMRNVGIDNEHISFLQKITVCAAACRGRALNKKQNFDIRMPVPQGA